MREEQMALLIPIIMFLVIGLVMVTYIYYHSKERQLLIEKGADAESIRAFFNEKKFERSPYSMLKLGIISVAFGLGLGIGIYIDDTFHSDFAIPFFTFVFTGIGFIAANLVGKNLEDKDKNSGLNP